MKKILISLLFVVFALTASFALTQKTSVNAEAAEAKIATVSSMIEDRQNLLPAFNYGGVERLSVNTAEMTIAPWSDGHFWYKSDSDGLNVCFKTTGGSDIFFVLRATAEGAPWGASRGYYLHLAGAGSALYKVPLTGEWQTSETQVMPFSVGNLFDGEYHRVKFVAVDVNETVVVIVQIDDGEEMIYTDTTDVFSKENTEIGIVPNSTKAYVVGDPTLVVPEAEYTVKYTTAHKMIENKDNLVPSFSGEAKLEVKNGEIIGWENGQFLYRGANAVDVNIQITNNCKEIAFSLKAASDGIMWQTTGYFLYVNEGTASLYRVADPSTWNAELLASVGVNNIFDGKVHNFKFYAVKDSLGHLQLGYSIDGANTTKAVDSGEILNEESDNFKIVSVNSTVLYKVLPDEAEHTYGEPEVTAPTCTEKGFETLTCTGCGHVIVREGAAALNHDYVETVTVATCLTGGYSTFTCSRCNDTYTDKETSSLGHAFEDKREEPTCTAAGKTYKECTRCNFIKDEEEISALGHDYETITTPATCTENGEQHEKCRRCNEETAQTVIPATGHNWVETDRVEATAEADGHVDYKCSKCEETKSEILTYEEPASSGESSGDAEEGCIASVGGGVNGIVILALLAAGIANKKRKD